MNKKIKVHSIKQLVKKALTNKENKLYIYELGKIPNSQIKKVKQLTKFDLTDYVRIIDCYSVTHTLLTHGNKNTEAKRGQIAVTSGDFELIPKVFKSPDKIIDGGINTKKNRIIRYYKQFNNIIVCCEEIREGKVKNTALVTMYIKKAK